MPPEAVLRDIKEHEALNELDIAIDDSSGK
jgi:hypothetical protein